MRPFDRSVPELWGSRFISVTAGALACVLLPLQSWAGGVVTNCDEASLRAAMRGGGLVTFACDGTIALSSMVIASNDVVLDAGGHQITISGGNAVRVFKVKPEVTLTLINLTVADGRHAGANGVVGLTNADGQPGFGGGVYNNRGTVNLVDCTLTNNTAAGGSGALNNTNGPAGSGGTAQGGAIFNNGGTLCVTNCVIAGNSVTGGAGGTAYGRSGGAAAGGNGCAGGIFNAQGTITLVRSTLANNTASGGSAGVLGMWVPKPGRSGDALGGAFWSNSGSTTASDSTFVFNRAHGAGVHPASAAGWGLGGAIYITNAAMTCLRCLLASNSATLGTYPFSMDAFGEGQGGAIYCEGTLTLAASRLYGNTAGGPSQSSLGKGGGIYNKANLNMRRCTLLGNLAQGGPAGVLSLPGGQAAGGAIYNLGQLAVTNSTFVANIAHGGNGLTADPGNGLGGGICNQGGAVTLAFDTLANNSAECGSGGAPVTSYGGAIFTTNGTVALRNCILANSLSGSNAVGTLTDGGGNLSSDASCHFSAPGSRNRKDPKLSPLDDFGGPTPTMALLAGSPAIDAATGTCPAADQRGIPRPFGPACDIGAFESAPPYSIRGYVGGYLGSSSGIAVTIDGASASVATSTGCYVVTGLVAGSYLVSPRAQDAVFVLSNRVVSVGPDAVEVNFTSYRSNALTIERLTDDRFRAVFAGHAGEVWQVWDATNLVDWTVCSTNTVESSGLFELLLTNSPQPALRFLKAAQP